MGTRAVCGAATWVVLVLLGGCASSGSEDGAPPAGTQPPSPSAGTQSAVPPQADPSPRPQSRREAALADARGLVYHAGRRARTGEWLLFAEQTDLRGRADVLPAVRAAMTDSAADPDYSSLWVGDVVDRVKLWWDGDEGYYAVRLRDEAATRRPPGMSMREAHLAIQQVVRTLQSVGGIATSAKFEVAGADGPVTDLLGIPATGQGDTYLAAHHSGVLNHVSLLAPAEGARVRGEVELSGLAESFEATVGIRVLAADGEVVHDYSTQHSTQASQCCFRLWPWRYSLDTTGWAPGTYVVEVRTDDPVGIEHGSDGPEIDTRTIVVEQTDEQARLPAPERSD